MPSSTPLSFNIEPLNDIKSVEDFVCAVFRLGTNGKLWYRGLSESAYKLIPSVGRTLKYAGNEMTLCRGQEIDLLHRFRRRAHPYVGRVMTAGEAIFVARHHGLPTRLLDWTANALFSLYFACFENEKHKKDGKVWAMMRYPPSDTKDLDAFKLAKLEDEEDLFHYPATHGGGTCNKYLKIIHPFYNSPRLLAQDGVFTFHSHPQEAIEDYEVQEFTRENLDIERLYWWSVPAASKVRIVKELSGLGITQRTVFPDLDGVAKSLWETEVLWSVS
jgi:FRG domain